MTVRVRLMNEYTVDWPLWVSDGPAQEGDVPIDEPLATELKTWARVFNEHYDWKRGWDDPAVAEGHAQEAVRLRGALQDALGRGYDVVLELWEVSDR
ncbi:hypothetical protein [Cellulomonas fengjieae]|uniref:Uncharacterized protein n=1 Tax=Cellulomonas fengjieae TaxID=2819978 RepID=A0ABS3SHG8_9CELL|nr:hypothetical protein [Cellulomonas fengjieae]MBO3085097.1 hypothetical protein [Cellulomonas fengjieae]QVI66319.1 hypothetical protein KG102_01490 [Cellulomonas fengjieae]